MKQTAGQSRRGMLALLLILLSGTSPCYALPFFDFYGFSYVVGQPLTVGSVVTVPARLNTIQPDPIWPLDFNLNEYTITVDALEIVAVDVYGPVVNVTFASSTIGLYRDPMQNSDFTPGPPNALVPATFVDGEPELTGVLSDMVMMFNSATGNGTVSGSIAWTGGSRLPELASPDGWTYFGGVSNHTDLGIPDGYDLAWDPQIYGPEVPVPVESGSWGRIKQLYR